MIFSLLAVSVLLCGLISIGMAISKYRIFNFAPIPRDNIMDWLSDGVVVLDVEARIVDANPEAKRIFGWKELPAGQFVNRYINNWVNPASLEPFNGSFKMETQSAQAGTSFYYELTISTLYNKNKLNTGTLIVIHDISGLKKAQKEMEELSLADELTGLHNRRGFKILSDQLICTAQRMKLNINLFYIDLDKLKWINDQLGHAAGDLALIDTSRILKEVFRSSDIIARFGGDEFVVLATESKEIPSDLFRDRLQKYLDRFNAQVNRDYHLSFSVGLARYEWNYPCSMESLLEQADQAMYTDKLEKDPQRSFCLTSEKIPVELEDGRLIFR
jgi:diguanylate cyclase (GGDEF)-like protein/PAS domain S-box-containing protein